MWNIKDIIQKLFSTRCFLDLVLQGRSLLKGSICSTMYTSYTGEQEANMPMYKLTLHFKYSEKILQFASSNLTTGLWMRKGNTAGMKCISVPWCI